MKKIALVFGLMMVMSVFGSMIGTAKAVSYGEPTDGGDGWFYADVWNVTNGCFKYNTSDFGNNLKINNTLYVDNATVTFENFTMIDITNLTVDDAVIEFVNSTVVFNNSFTVNGTFKLIESTATFNVIDYYTMNKSAKLFYVENSTIYNFSMFEWHSNITFIGSMIEYQSEICSEYFDGNFSATNTKIYSDNITCLTFGYYAIFTPTITPTEHIVPENSVNIDGCVFENVTIGVVSPDVVIKDTVFSTEHIYNNNTLAIATGGELSPLMIWSLENGSVVLDGNTFHDTIISTVIFGLNNTENSIVDYTDNMVYDVITGMILMSYNDTYYVNISMDISGNTFERVGKNTELMELLGNEAKPLSIVLGIDNGTGQYITVEKNDFRDIFGAVTVVGNITEVPVIKNNLFVDFSNALTFYVNDTVEEIDVSENWWYRDGFDIDNTSFYQVSTKTELQEILQECLVNDSIQYDIVSNINESGVIVKPYNEFPLPNITITLHSGWNLIGIPFLPTMNITEIFENTDIEVMVFVNGDEYIPVFHMLPIEINFTWTSLYVYVSNNTTFEMNNSNSQIVKWELHEGWNLIPYIPLGDRDLYNIINSSDIEVMVIISDNGTYTPFYMNITTSAPAELNEFTLGDSMYVYVSNATTVTIQEYSYYDLFEGTPPSF